MDIENAKMELDLLIQNLPAVLDHARRLAGLEYPLPENSSIACYVKQLREQALRARQDLED